MGIGTVIRTDVDRSGANEWLSVHRKWLHDFMGLTYKKQHYRNSCFPCCIATIIKNMGTATSRSDKNYEDRWNYVIRHAPLNRTHKGLGQYDPVHIDIAYGIETTWDSGAIYKFKIPRDLYFYDQDEMAVDNTKRWLIVFPKFYLASGFSLSQKKLIGTNRLQIIRVPTY